MKEWVDSEQDGSKELEERRKAGGCYGMEYQD